LAKNSLTEISRCAAAIDWAVARLRGRGDASERSVAEPAGLGARPAPDFFDAFFLRFFNPGSANSAPPAQHAPRAVGLESGLAHH
jgi:hypothetical protein